jgi:hypothetical protein
MLLIIRRPPNTMVEERSPIGTPEKELPQRDMSHMRVNYARLPAFVDPAHGGSEWVSAAIEAGRARWIALIAHRPRSQVRTSTR